MSAPPRTALDLDKDFLVWLQQHGVGYDASKSRYDWDTLSTSKQAQLWDEYSKEGSPKAVSEPTTGRPPPQDKKPKPKAESKQQTSNVTLADAEQQANDPSWPTNVQHGLRVWLLQHGIDARKWSSSDQDFRAEQRKSYGGAADKGNFSFSVEERQTLVRAGYTDAQISQMERLLSTYDDQTQRDQAKSQYLRSAQTKQTQATGIIQQGDENVNVLVAHGTGNNPTDPTSTLLGTSEDTYKSLPDVVSEPYGWKAEQVTALQNKLVRIGALLPGTFQPGKYDAATAKAYGDSVRNAAGSHQTPDEYLTQAPDNALGGGKHDPYQPQPKEVLDERQIRSIAQEAGIQLLGRAPNEQQMQHIVTRFRSAEDRYYQESEGQRKAEYDAGVKHEAAPGTTITDKPDVGVITQSELENTTEAAGYRVAKSGLDLINLLRSGR